MPAVFGILMLTATMAAAEPNVMHYQLQKNCDKLAAQTFHREMADDEGRVDYRAHYNARLNKCFYAETYISRTPMGINKWVYLPDLQENQPWLFLLQPPTQGMPLRGRVELTCKGVHGRLISRHVAPARQGPRVRVGP